MHLLVKNYHSFNSVSLTDYVQLKVLDDLMISDLRHFGTTKLEQDISAQHNQCRPKSVQKKRTNFLYLAFIEKIHMRS